VLRAGVERQRSSCLLRARLVERQRRGRAIYYRIADPRLPELVELALGMPN
jgi:DNA-binding transcriptional ArsR family regulator